MWPPPSLAQWIRDIDSFKYGLWVGYKPPKKKRYKAA